MGLTAIAALLSVAGALLTILGAVIGWRALRRHDPRVTRAQVILLTLTALAFSVNALIRLADAA